MDKNELRNFVAKWYLQKTKDELYSFGNDLVSLCLEQVVLKMERENLDHISPEKMESEVLQRWFAHTEIRLREAEQKLKYLKSL